MKGCETKATPADPAIDIYERLANHVLTDPSDRPAHCHTSLSINKK